MKAWLEDKSDWLSPIVVKEVRQIVRGREFNYSFGASLVAGLAVAFFGSADAIGGSGTSGSWTFVALMSCLTILCVGIVPLGAFNALRNERMEQTFDLITLTALSPRRVVIGKLLAQGVKLATLFAGMAPFIAMSFLLGGIDFVTILVSLLVLFMWSLWASAAGLFLSSLFKTRAMSGLLFGGLGVLLFLAFGAGRTFYSLRFIAPSMVGGVATGAGTGARSWLPLAIMTTFCGVTLVNLVLLAENRLSLRTDSRVTALRIGFLVQFLLLAAWVLKFVNATAVVRSNAVDALGVIGGLHLAMVAMFTVTEDLSVSRRVLQQLHGPSRWQWLLAIFRPGGGRGALYVLAQMFLLLVVGWLLGANGMERRWLLAICGYTCFFTGVPTLIFRAVRPLGMKSLYARVAILLLMPVSLLAPDIIHYVVWRPEVLSFSYSARHLVNPFRTLVNWDLVETHNWLAAPLVLGLIGVFAYLALILMGRRMTALAAPVEPPSPAAAGAGEPGSANALY